ncbi:hypothetical protein ACFE04_012409 [Oxalis oulophora]
MSDDNMNEPKSSLAAKYRQQLQQHPLRTKAITAGFLAGCSDLIAQKISGVKKIQFRRTLLILLYGLLYSGPFGHFFHKFMGQLFKENKTDQQTASKKTISPTVIKKVILEQLTSSPWNNMVFMLYYGLVVEGRPWFLVKKKIQKDYPIIQLTAWKFWPIVGFVNYQYMPEQFRAIFQSFVGACWAIFLNLKARSSVPIAIKSV